MQSTQQANLASPISPLESKSPSSHDPVLTPEDEAFFREVMSRPENAGGGVTAGSPVSPLSPVAHDPQHAEEIGKQLGEEERRASTGDKGKEPEPEPAPAPAEGKKKGSGWGWLRRMGTKKKKSKDENATAPAPAAAAATTTAIDADAKPSDSATKETTSEPQEQPQQEPPDDMADVLEQLSLAAENNQVFSASDEMQELLRKFKLIFKDLINGVPTAYNDLEMLLKNGNKQLQDTYSGLPGFLQKLIQKLPEKWTEALGPEILAAAGEKATQSGMSAENVGKASAAASKMGFQVPSLKELVGKPAAIVGMMRSIVAFLKARFPAVVGVNMLWSLALSILLFVLWYCHKRGKEVRLENERIVTEQEIEKMNEEFASGERTIRTTETFTTTAPRGAPATTIREGVREVEQARETANSTPAEGNGGKEEEIEKPPPAPVPAPTRSKSKLWSRSSQKPDKVEKMEPYPGT